MMTLINRGQLINDMHVKVNNYGEISSNFEVKAVIVSPGTFCMRKKTMSSHYVSDA